MFSIIKMLPMIEHFYLTLFKQNAPECAWTNTCLSYPTSPLSLDALASTTLNEELLIVSLSGGAIGSNDGGATDKHSPQFSFLKIYFSQSINQSINELC